MEENNIIYNHSTNTLFVKKGKLIYNLKFRPYKVQILGDSATGKSLLSHLIDVFKETDKFNGTSCADNICNVKSYEDWKNESNKKNCLFVVDCAEYVFGKNLDFVLGVKHDRVNQYLIISRVSYNLGISPNNYAYLNEKDNVFTLNYLMTIKGL